MLTTRKAWVLPMLAMLALRAARGCAWVRSRRYAPPLHFAPRADSAKSVGTRSVSRLRRQSPLASGAGRTRSDLLFFVLTCFLPAAVPLARDESAGGAKALPPARDLTWQRELFPPCLEAAGGLLLARQPEGKIDLDHIASRGRNGAFISFIFTTASLKSRCALAGCMSTPLKSGKFIKSE